MSIFKISGSAGRRSAEENPSELDRDMKVVRRFIEVYCREHHGVKDGDFCEDCADLMAYAKKKREKCPLDPKPKCKDCEIHCYTTEYRQRIRDVMRFSGAYFVKRGRLDWALKYFFA